MMRSFVFSSSRTVFYYLNINSIILQRSEGAERIKDLIQVTGVTFEKLFRQTGFFVLYI